MFKKALVTGGAGFIGSFFCERLAVEQLSFTIVDNLFRGKKSNVAHLLNDQNKLCELDLVESDSVDALAALIIDEQPDLIVHYAAINGTEYFYDEPAKVVEVNSIATYNLLQAVKKAKANGYSKKPLFVFASTSENYGEPFNLPTSEDDLTYVRLEYDRDSYAAGKLVSEFYTKLFCRELDINWIVLRIFNVYGPRMVGTKYGQVIPEFINRISQGEYPLQIIGDGQQTRSFCHIDDHIELTWQLMQKQQGYNDVYNLGNPDEVSIKELAELVLEKFDKEPRIEHREARVGDHIKRKPDITKLLSLLGGYDFIDLSSGVSRIINQDEKV